MKSDFKKIKQKRIVPISLAGFKFLSKKETHKHKASASIETESYIGFIDFKFRISARKTFKFTNNKMSFNRKYTVYFDFNLNRFYYN